MKYVKIITTECENALINGLMSVFNNVQHICCYYHYKQDCIRYIKKLRLYKLYNYKEVMETISKLPFEYKGDIHIYDELKNKHKNFSNFIDNYFNQYKRKYFINGDYNYINHIERIRTNSYIETYN